MAESIVKVKSEPDDSSSTLVQLMALGAVPLQSLTDEQPPPAQPESDPNKEEDADPDASLSSLQNILALGALPLSSYIPKSPTPAPPESDDDAAPDVGPEARGTSQEIGHLYQTCQRMFGSANALKWEYGPDGGTAGNKKATLIITRPDGTSRTYKSRGDFSKKMDAKSSAAAVAIESGAIDFLLHGTDAKSKRKSGEILATAIDGEKKPLQGELDEVTIKEHCSKWRLGKVQPVFTYTVDVKGQIGHGCVLSIYLSATSNRSWSVDTVHPKKNEARAAVCTLAIRLGVLDYIAHGDGQQLPPDPNAPLEQKPSTADPAFAAAVGEGKSKLMSQQSYYDSLPKPLPEDVGLGPNDHNPIAFVNQLVQKAKGCRLSCSFTFTSDPKLGLHGCLLRIDHPPVSYSYLVPTAFAKRQEAKLSVCLLAICQGIGDLVRDIQRKNRAEAYVSGSGLGFVEDSSGRYQGRKNYLTEEERSLGRAAADAISKELSDFRSGAVPRFDFSQNDSGLTGAQVEVYLSRNDRRTYRTYSVPREYKTRIDAKLAVSSVAVEQGILEFIRFRGEPPPADYRRGPISELDVPHVLRLTGAPHHSDHTSGPLLPPGRSRDNPPILETREEAFRREQARRRLSDRPVRRSPSASSPVSQRRPSYEQGALRRPISKDYPGYGRRPSPERAHPDARPYDEYDRRYRRAGPYTDYAEPRSFLYDAQSRSYSPYFDSPGRRPPPLLPYDDRDYDSRRELHRYESVPDPYREPPPRSFDREPLDSPLFPARRDYGDEVYPERHNHRSLSSGRLLSPPYGLPLPDGNRDTRERPYEGHPAHFDVNRPLHPTYPIDVPLGYLLAPRDTATLLATLPHLNTDSMSARAESTFVTPLTTTSSMPPASALSGHSTVLPIEISQHSHGYPLAANHGSSSRTGVPVGESGHLSAGRIDAVIRATPAYNIHHHGHTHDVVDLPDPFNRGGDHESRVVQRIPPPDVPHIPRLPAQGVSDPRLRPENLPNHGTLNGQLPLNPAHERRTSSSDDLNVQSGLHQSSSAGIASADDVWSSFNSSGPKGASLRDSGVAQGHSMPGGAHKRPRPEDMQNEASIASDISKSYVDQLLEFCAKTNQPKPAFHEVEVPTDHGVAYKLWILVGKEKMELATTFPTVEIGRERLSRQVLSHLRALFKKRRLEESGSAGDAPGATPTVA